MTKLWQKGYEPDKEIEKFTVGDDYVLDNKLLKFDVVGSIAHAEMLAKAKILKPEELKKLKTELKNILKNKQFEIKQEDEDVHTAVENYLTKKLGDLGKKIHTARSRNDHVLVDTKLYTKEQLLEIETELLKLCSNLLNLAKNNKNTAMPGFTHTQKAMPSSAALFFGAFLESLLDDLILIKTAYKLNNQCPLGSAAGYGVSLDIDRQLVSDLLGFEKVQNNVLYVQNSRGKIESVVLSSLNHVMLDLSKLANNLIWFSTPEFNFFSIPEKFTTGSSIMPQKKNPDVLELVRAKSSVMQSYVLQVENIAKDLPIGYNRDLQLTKKPLLEGLELALSAIKIMDLVLSGLNVNKEACKKALSPEIFATDAALGLVKNGMPWREAYKKVGANLDKLKSEDPVKNILGKKHIGATGNLGLEKSEKTIKEEINSLIKEKENFSNKINKLMS